jgi:anaerobic selenocysteine-containing dehydrogenase
VGDPLDALTEGVLTGSHPVDLLFVLGWDPLFDHPSGGRLAEALRRIPTVVSFAPFLDETATVSDITLPASLFMESWVCTTTPSTVPFGTVGIGGPVVEPLFDTRNPGDVILELARRVGSGSSALAAWPTYDSYLRHRLEGLAMVGQGSLFEGALEESWVRYLENRGWRFVEHDDFEGFWADMVRQGGWWNPTIPESAWPQVFPTPSGKFEFWSLTLEESLRGIGEEQESADSTPGEALVRGMEIIGIEAEPDEACFPRHQEPMSSGEGDLRLMTFRPITSRGPLGVTSAMHLEMFGHTLLSGWETWGEVAPETAEALGMGDGDIIRFETDLDGAQLVLRIRPGCVTGVVQVPIGLGHEGEMGPGTGVGTNPLRLLLPLRDPMTGAAALNGTMGRVQLVRRRPHGQPPPSYQGHAS